MTGSFFIAGWYDTAWSVIAFLGGAAAIAAMVWVARSGEPEREAEDAARRFFDEHGHWPDEEPPR